MTDRLPAPVNCYIGQKINNVNQLPTLMDNPQLKSKEKINKKTLEFKNLKGNLYQ